VFDPRGGAWMDGKYVPSLLAAIGEVIERHMIEIGFLPARPGRDERALQVVNLAPEQPPGNTLGFAGPRLRQMPEMRRGGADPPRRLRPMHQLWLFQMRVGLGMSLECWKIRTDEIRVLRDGASRLLRMT